MIFRTLVCLCLAIPSIAQASGDYSSEACNNLNSMYDFSVYTPVLGNDPRETIYAERSDRKTGKNFTPVVLWTNELEENIGFPVIRDSRTSDNPAVSPENIYYVWLTYKANNPSQGGNKTGLLTYYLYVNGDWEKVEEGEADLSGLAKPQLYVHGEGSLSVECSTSTVPPPPKPDLDQVCRYFPEPIQGWKGSTSTLNITNDTAYAAGWSSEYLADDANIYNYQQNWPEGTNWDNLRVGFDRGVGWHVYKNPSASSCNGYGCFPADGVSGDGFSVGNDGLVESRKAETPTKITPNFGSSSLYISPDKNDTGLVTEEFCNNNPSICSYDSSSSGPKQPQITVLSSLKNLTINNHDDPFDKLTVVIVDGVQIESVNITRGDNVLFQTLDKSTVTFGTLEEDTGATVYSFGKNSIINIVTSFNMSNPMQLANKNNVMLYAPEGEIVFHTETADFYGFILGKTVIFNKPITVHGSVTSQNLTMKSNVVIQRPTDACSTGGGNVEGKFVVEPRWQYGLICEQIPVDFKLLNDRGELVDSNNSFVPIASPDSNTTWCSYEQGSSCDLTSANLSNGEKTLYLSAESIGDLAVGAIYDSQNYSGGSVKFVPYKLHVTPSVVEMIAGEDASVSVQALSCDGDQAKVVENYNSSLAMSLDNYELEKPNTGSLYDFNVSNLQFIKGSTDATVTWQDVGQTKVVFEDANFDCSDFEQEGANFDCPIDGGVLKGEFTVKSRPWKIAACNIVAKNGGKLNPETQDSKEGFIPAGESFNVTYKPIVHSDSRGDENDANNVCDYPLTQNYFSDANTTAPLGVEFSVLYPSDGDIANLATATDDSSNLDFSSEEAKTGKTLEYAWDEAGSLNLKTTATYLGMDLDEDDEVTVGRFYPKYFKVVASTWDYPGDQVFAYMDQPFDGVDFSVEALNADKVAIKNYASFTTKAEFNLDEIDSYSGRFDAPDFGAGSWSNESDKSMGDFSISNSGQCIGSACWNKDLDGNYPDGPFNSVVGTDTSEIGLVYTDNADPVEYIIDDDKGTNSRLVVQPDIRFGRVNLDDVGGRQGETLHIPLRVEYWNGSRFVVNSNDSQTDVSGIKWAQKHIWPKREGAAPKDVNLGDGGEVSSGSSRSVTATQAEAYRQQTRVWLDLEANNLPWLKYNWDDDTIGEENPSSVVTFGIHRGNDRVIYRGEPGLTAQ